MKVIQASLYRAEKNNIRIAVRSLKEERIDKNLRDKNQERTEMIKMTNEEKMANVLKRKQ